ncbi:UDP-N-acetylenolpyruvoylglucosamine reductase [Candidatus Kaiserbacteria bacterium RIFCSPLOWO2_01_FULL_53_17]|uniref:UDP-N-acetylenolpyruvoylglucosamine reductase n=1 Tax=Candidatus Kaiserbacteria bacterium RIFCSPLOWO2_01_FULL_53_17 TaxID=1798511 RepID=A0A1F6EH87_9BACT|nr:MAG: UDP-N-acetylenolpyruvoylglucosamine reductase [Candidatus Kaiserbacteria bacterium RIFCSPLOWO2_01_FULL_53_17]
MLNIQENKPLSDLTTFEIGGPAKYFVEVKTDEEIHDALGWAREHNVPFFVMGGGSNLLIPDEGFEGLVIHIVSNHFSFFNMTGLRNPSLEADAGCNLLTLIRAAADEGFGGWEKLGGIPGTIGGAVRGNAGAFGPEIKDFLTWARAINTKTEDVHEFTNAECEFAYRMSYFKKNPEWIITKAHIQLNEVKPHQSKQLIEDTITEREKRHIQNVRAAGSYFMNPVAPANIVAMFEKEKGVRSRGGRVPAGWLIEKAGMKGVRVGDAISSEQHPNYLVNAGNAKATEVRALAEKIKAAVKSKFEVELEEEAVVL